MFTKTSALMVDGCLSHISGPNQENISELRTGCGKILATPSGLVEEECSSHKSGLNHEKNPEVKISPTNRRYVQKSVILNNK